MSAIVPGLDGGRDADPPSGCACPTRDAYDCIRRRYPSERLAEVVDPCECDCHDAEEWDDA